MSFANVERMIWAEAKTVFNNPKLRKKDIIEWSNSEQRVRDNAEGGEVVAALPELGAWVCVAAIHDKRA